jgi:glycosyltransferase involved in cell wall biosynthesis
VHRATPGSDTVARLFAAADVFCLPTTRDACPWVVLEAMASGVPVVSTRVGSIPEMVGAAGLTVKPNAPRELRGALMSLLEDRGRREAAGRAGRERAAERYDARTNTPRLLAMLFDLAGRSNGRHGAP